MYGLTHACTALTFFQLADPSLKDAMSVYARRFANRIEALL